MPRKIDFVTDQYNPRLAQMLRWARLAKRLGIRVDDAQKALEKAYEGLSKNERFTIESIKNKN